MLSTWNLHIGLDNEYINEYCESLSNSESANFSYSKRVFYDNKKIRGDVTKRLNKCEGRACKCIGRIETLSIRNSIVYATTTSSNIKNLDVRRWQLR